MYPLFIQKREQFNKHFGRFPLHAYTSALDVLIRDRKELKLEVEVDGQRYPVKTPLIFFGNNQLQLAEHETTHCRGGGKQAKWRAW